jgi:hypothetical protein
MSMLAIALWPGCNAKRFTPDVSRSNFISSSKIDSAFISVLIISTPRWMIYDDARYGSLGHDEVHGIQI